MDPVAVAMVVVRPEMLRTVVRHEVTLSRRDPVDIPVLADPHEVTAAFPNDISSAMGVAVEGCQTVSGGVAYLLGPLSSGACRRTAG